MKLATAIFASFGTTARAASTSAAAYGVILATSITVGVASARSPGCSVTTIGVDTSLAEPDTIGTMGLRCGEAGGETFSASDTLVRSISVWRHHAQTPYGGSLKLWILGTLPDGSPNLGDIVLEGPT